MKQKRALRVARRAERRAARRPTPVRAKPRALAVVPKRESLFSDETIAEYYFG